MRPRLRGSVLNDIKGANLLDGLTDEELCEWYRVQRLWETKGKKKAKEASAKASCFVQNRSQGREMIPVVARRARFDSICILCVRGRRFRALGVDSGPRGGAFEGVLDPQNNNKYIFVFRPHTHFFGFLSLARAAFELGLGLPWHREARRCGRCPMRPLPHGSL